jgi:hypothetical protein
MNIELIQKENSVFLKISSKFFSIVPLSEADMLLYNKLSCNLSIFISEIGGDYPVVKICNSTQMFCEIRIEAMRFIGKLVESQGIPQGCSTPLIWASGPEIEQLMDFVTAA